MTSILSLSLVAGGDPSWAAEPPSPPIKVTQNYSETVSYDFGLRCTSGDTAWYRRFELSRDHESDLGFSVSKVTFGLTLAPAEASMTVSTFAIAPDVALTLANLEPLTSAPVTVTADEAPGSVEVPISAQVPADKDLVVRIFSATSSAVVGMNADPELREDYLTSEACGLTEPTSVASLGFPQGNHVILAFGKSTDCSVAEDEVPLAEQALAVAEQDLTDAEQSLESAQERLTQAQVALDTASRAVTRAEVVKDQAKKQYHDAKRAGEKDKAARLLKKKKKLKAEKQAAKRVRVAAIREFNVSTQQLAAAERAATEAEQARDEARTRLDAAEVAAVDECRQPELPVLSRPDAQAPADPGAMNHGLSATSGR